MGEIADMMLDGTMCQVCGEFMDLGEDPAGYPVTCAGCIGEGLSPDDDLINVRDLKTVVCPEPLCERKFRSRQAAGQHWIDKH